MTVTDNDNSSNTIQKNVEIIPIYDETDENISDINLNYNSKNKGKNYIVWKGTAVNASELAISTQLSTGESISIFDSNTGVWREYIVGSSGLAQDFLISTFDVIIITCKSQKSIALDVSQQNNDYPSSITLSYNYNLNTKTGNPGVNFLIWPVNTTIRCRDLANRVSLLYGYTIHKYDNELGKWSSFVVGVDIEDPSFNYTVSKFDILCIYVEEEKILTLS